MPMTYLAIKMVNGEREWQRMQARGNLEELKGKEGCEVTEIINWLSGLWEGKVFLMDRDQAD